MENSEKHFALLNVYCSWWEGIKKQRKVKYETFGSRLFKRGQMAVKKDMRLGLTQVSCSRSEQRLLKT